MLAAIGSITTAARFSKLIERNTGSRADVIHTPASINKGGCSYSVRFGDVYSGVVRQLAAEYRVAVKKYYSEQGSGRGRVYNALS